jgi:DegV family protein with EDD domain
VIIVAIKVLADSTCDLPANIVDELGINVVPLYINIGDQGYLDGVELSRQDFYKGLPTFPMHPTTGTPGMDRFHQAFQQLADEGATEIISIHISESLSATVSVARQAAAEFSAIPVHVVDSQQLSMGTGFQVEAAARLALKGASSGEILTHLDDLAGRSFVAAGLSTLEFLRRSGRMNRFMAGLGSLLQIKPILTMQGGIPGSVRVRTTAKAEEQLIHMFEERAPIERFALLHTHDPDGAQKLRKKLDALIPGGEEIAVDITPVIGAHIGPGAVGYAIVSVSL